MKKPIDLTDRAEGEEIWWKGNHGTLMKKKKKKQMKKKTKKQPFRGRQQCVLSELSVALERRRTTTSSATGRMLLQ